LLTESDLQVGRFVQHTEWGTGLLRDVESRTGQVVIDFYGKPGHSMGRDIAVRVLNPVVNEGLRAMAWKAPDAVAAWVKSAPLRLVVAALRDLGGQSRSNQIRDVLESRVMGQFAWSTWWSRTRQMIKTVEEIQITPRGLIRLTRPDTVPGDLPEAPLSDAPKKGPRPKTESGVDLYEKLKDGRIELGGMTAEEIRRTCHQIAKNRDWGRLTDSRADSLWSGQAYGIKAVLDSLKQENLHSVLIQVFGRLAAAIAHGAREFAAGNVHNEEWVVKRSEILAAEARDMRAPLSVEWRSSEVRESYRSLARAWALLTDLTPRTWADAATQSLQSALKALIQLDPESAYAYGLVLCDLDIAPTVKDRMARALLDDSAVLIADHYSWQLLKACPDIVVDAFWERLRANVRPEAQRLMENLHSLIGSGIDEDLRRSANAVAKLFTRISADLPSRSASRAAELGLTIAVLTAHEKDDLGDPLAALIVKALNSRSSSAPTAGRKLLPVFAAAEQWAATRTDAEKARTRAVERDASRLRDEVLHLAAELERTSALVKELKSALGEPERLAEFQGQRNVLDELGACYREFAARAHSSSDSPLRGVLARIEQAFQRFGGRSIGSSGDRVTFDPEIHQFVPDDPQSGDHVEIIFPGYFIRDAAGRQNVIVRAVVRSM